MNIPFSYTLFIGLEQYEKLMSAFDSAGLDRADLLSNIFETGGAGTEEVNLPCVTIAAVGILACSNPLTGLIYIAAAVAAGCFG